MILKLVIIGAIVAAGLTVFSQEIDYFFPETSANVVDSLSSDIGAMTDGAVDKVEDRIDEAAVTVEQKIDSAVEGAEQKIDDVKESSKNLIGDKIDNVNPIKEIEEVIVGTQEELTESIERHGSSKSSQLSQSSSSTVSMAPTEKITYETLSLSTNQQDNDNILLSYEDSSGKTISVTVTMRNSEQEIFSGVFYSSMFETIINDANDEYFIDMIVEHKEYGTVSSSVFNPGDSTNSTINGIFSQPQH